MSELDCFVKGAGEEPALAAGEAGSAPADSTVLEAEVTVLAAAGGALELRLLPLLRGRFP